MNTEILNRNIYAHQVASNSNDGLNVKYYKNKYGLGQFNLLYLNINSIRNKLTELEIQLQLILNETKKIVHFVALTEIRILDYDKPYFNLPEYNSFFSTRLDGDGGCALFVHESIKCKLIYEHSSDNVNTLIVNIIDLNLNIAVVYKQPMVAFNTFESHIYRCLDTNIKTIIVGDMNINLLSNSNNVKRYIDMSIENGFYILNKINTKYATRIATRKRRNRFSTSRTIIDHILVNINEYNYKCYMNDSPLSDHKELHLVFSKNNEANFALEEEPVMITKLKYDKYTDELINAISGGTNIESFSDLAEILLKCKNENLQTKNIIKRGNPYKPWISESLLNLIKHRKRYFYLLKRSPTNEYLQKKYKDICQSIKFQKGSLRSNYYSTLINNNLGNPKLIWREINQAIHNKTRKSNSVGAIRLKNSYISNDPKAISNELNLYFKDVGKSLYDEIAIKYPNINNNTLTFTGTNSIYLLPTNSLEILNYINSLKTNKGVNDVISSYTLKRHNQLFAPLLSDLINNCFIMGSFPQILKCARIVPLFKSGDPLDVNNYRPISILPSLSKIIEMALYQRLIKYFTDNNFIDSNQYGFQKNSGTLSAASTLINHLQKNCDTNTNITSSCVFIDLKKAFDTVPHNLLLEKLSNYGVRGTANSLIESYLNNRKQYVNINNISSETIVNTNGFSLPQGSNLGPFFFLVYINDIFQLKLNGFLILFADDAVLVNIDSNGIKLKEKTQKDLDMIHNWLVNNRLTLNAEKTKYMLINRNSARVMDLDIRIDDKQIERVANFTYLGINIGENIKWNTHVDSICGKSLGLVGAIKRLGNRIHKSTKITLFHAMFNSVLTYLLPVWGTSSSNFCKNKLQIVQNKIIRSIFVHEYYQLRMSTSEIRKEYSILDIEQSLVYSCTTLMYKIENSLIKTDHRIARNNEHGYMTRNRNDPRLNHYRTETGRNNIFRICTSMYNSINRDIKNETAVHKFKKKLKQNLLNSN